MIIKLVKKRLQAPYFGTCSVVPPAGFEPAHPPPEGGALSPELRGRGAELYRTHGTFRPPPTAGQLGGVNGNGWAPRSASICAITDASDVCASSILPAKLATIGLAAWSAAYCIMILPP